ncbi:hypothetical protein SAMN05444274_104118 [Mariniphaga anaerophila]|uniref:Homospermidine synthase (Spermidine-specific) n=1 Tax=Mariniphaga anaerophila TaxID=1484053 RepID=A0A1M4ZZX1_9BACT|nr:hypothetical protein [Mariniphaga anaerophila]SHF23262.1 hypothetical protein SAMN05444274_104118 [Mariniphaga anaerophila]
MAHLKFDRTKLDVKRLADRKNKVYIERDHIPVNQAPQNLTEKGKQLIKKTADRIRKAKELGKSRMLTFGAHTIKNGMAPTLIALMKEGWITHLATNGAGIIHDWEFAYQGKSSEDVRENVNLGQFGIWDDTGFYINLALIVGGFEGLGYGESVGKMIHNEGLEIPEPSFLYEYAKQKMESDPATAAGAIDFAGAIRQFNLTPGWMEIPHPYKKYAVQANAFALGIPFTGHPMFGHDIIYNHPMNHGAAIGRTALNDFLYFAKSVSNLEDGVYLSVGSAVMSPMIFEKSLSMSQNVEIQYGTHIDNHYMLIVDLAESDWDWAKDGEPPMDNPAYYLRYCKTFNRMGGEMHYLTADNRDFLLELHHQLKSNS